MRYFPNDAGWLEVICGSMFSGKTTELIRRLDRMRRAGRKVQVFSRDTRFADDAVVSHDQIRHACTYAETSEGIMDALDWSVEVIGIDEGQFYDAGLIKVCRNLADKGKIVIVAGLDQDFRTEPFEVMIRLMAEAEFVKKLCAVCVRCGNPAVRNFRKGEQADRIVPGAGDLYQALCRRCYETAVAEAKQKELF